MTNNCCFASEKPTEDLSDDNLISFWDQVKKALITHYGEAIFKSWFSIIEPEKCQDQTLILSVPTPFTKDWIRANYLRSITDLCLKNASHLRFVELVVRDNAQRVSSAAATTVNPAPEPAVDLSAILNARYTFNNFVVGAPNELAYASAKAIAEFSGSSNPLFLHGAVGLGKTHLMQSIAWHAKQSYAKKRVVYMSAENFMHHFIRALRSKEMIEFKEAFRKIDVLMIDDIHFICGKDSTQKEFLHVFNGMLDQQKQVVIASSISPIKLGDMGQELRSRLSWGLTVDLQETNYQLRLAILRSKARQLNIEIPEEILVFLATKITSSIRELEGALNKVVAHRDFTGGIINLENIQPLLSGLLRPVRRNISIADVQNKVCTHYNIDKQDLTSGSRVREVVRARQIAMYLAKQLTTKSLLEIAYSFNKKDHTTVMHAIRTIEELNSSQDQVSQELKLLIMLLQAL